MSLKWKFEREKASCWAAAIHLDRETRLFRTSLTILILQHLKTLKADRRFEIHRRRQISMW